MSEIWLVKTSCY